MFLSKDYSEVQLIQKSTAEFLEKESGWKSVYAFDQETTGMNGSMMEKQVLRSAI